MNDHERWRDALSPYLLGALDATRAAELEDHLANCEECRTELAWLRPAAQTLPDSVERVEPPPALRARVMAEVRADADPVTREGSKRRGFHWPRATGFRFAAGVATLLVIVGVVAGYGLSGGDSSGDATTVVAGKAPGVTATMVSEDGSGTLHLANLEELPLGKVLQAWVRRGKRVESANVLFAPNPDGTASAVIDDIDGVNAVMVTAEPQGGSSFPTSSPLISIPVPQS